MSELKNRMFERAEQAFAAINEALGMRGCIDPSQTLDAVADLIDDAERYRYITRPGRTKELRIPAEENKESCDAAFDSKRFKGEDK